MRPLSHPALENITVEGILHALSDPVRAAIYAEIAGAGVETGEEKACGLTCSNFLTVKEREVPKSTLSQHFKVLREAGLIRSERRGVEMHSTSRCAEIETRFPGLLPSILAAHLSQQAPAGKPKKPVKTRSGLPKKVV